MSEFSLYDVMQKVNQLDEEVAESFHNYMRSLWGWDEEAAIMALSRPLEGRTYAEMTCDVAATVLQRDWSRILELGQTR